MHLCCDTFRSACPCTSPNARAIHNRVAASPQPVRSLSWPYSSYPKRLGGNSTSDRRASVKARLPSLVGTPEVSFVFYPGLLQSAHTPRPPSSERADTL